MGYVQDDETPEQIMKKFEELERIRQASKAAQTQANDEGDKENVEAASNTAVDASNADEGEERALDEEQLKTLFENTSTFTLKEAVMDSSTLYGDSIAIYGSEERTFRTTRRPRMSSGKL